MKKKILIIAAEPFASDLAGFITGKIQGHEVVGVQAGNVILVGAGAEPTTSEISEVLAQLQKEEKQEADQLVLQMQKAYDLQQLTPIADYIPTRGSYSQPGWFQGSAHCSMKIPGKKKCSKYNSRKHSRNNKHKK